MRPGEGLRPAGHNVRLAHTDKKLKASGLQNVTITDDPFKFFPKGYRFNIQGRAYFLTEGVEIPASGKIEAVPTSTHQR